MENNDNRIDQLFRDHLSGNEAEPTAAEWAAIESVLDKRKSRRKFFFLLISFLAIIATGSAIFIGKNNEVNHSATAATTSTTSNEKSYSENTQHNSVASTSQQNTIDAEKTNDVNNNPETLSPEDNSTRKNDDQLNQQEQEKKSSSTKTHPVSTSPNPRKEKASPGKNGGSPKDTFFPVNNVTPEEEKEKRTTVHFAYIPEEKETFKGDTSPSENLHFTSGETEKSNEQNNPGSEPGKLVINEKIKNRSLLDTLNYRSILLSRMSPNLIDYKLPTLPRSIPWSLQLTPLLAYSTSTIKGNSSPSFYHEKRNKEEEPQLSFGFEASMNYSMRRFQVGFGLQYFSENEKINYTPEIEGLVTELDSTFEYIIISMTEIDSFMYEGAWAYDTTSMILYNDTNITMTETEETRRINNDSVTMQNGNNKIQHVIIPLRFQYDLLKGNPKNQLSIAGSVEADFVFSRKGYYLSPDMKSAVSMKEIPGYRDFNTNVSLGIMYRRSLSEKLYLIVNPFTRTSTSSWNSEYTHKTMQYGLRFGVGIKF